MPDPVPCSVCAKRIEPKQHAICDECLRPFHLNLRTDVDESSCGAAYVGAACGMSVYCDPCGSHLGANAGASGAPTARVG